MKQMELKLLGDQSSVVLSRKQTSYVPGVVDDECGSLDGLEIKQQVLFALVGISLTGVELFKAQRRVVRGFWPILRDFQPASQDSDPCWAIFFQVFSPEPL